MSAYVSRSSNKIILIPYAEKQGANTGVNIAATNKRQEIYMKNCCVSACSAKKNNQDADVAIVTNIDFPDKFVQILKNNRVSIIKVPFDKFFLGDSYVWSLAFYKLCALYHIVREYDYQYYAYLDADVYVQMSFENIWKECDHNIILYDINHGLQVNDYKIFLREIEEFYRETKIITHYGGEFFAANRENALVFSACCEKICMQMMDIQFKTTKGDEFILSVAAHEMKEIIKNAGAYVYRFWTGGFRLVSSCFLYNPVAVLHVPAEKESGIITLFDRYFAKQKVPSNNAVYRILHLKRRALRVSVSMNLKRIIRCIVRR